MQEAKGELLGSVKKLIDGVNSSAHPKICKRTPVFKIIIKNTTRRLAKFVSRFLEQKRTLSLRTTSAQTFAIQLFGSWETKRPQSLKSFRFCCVF